MGTVTVVSGVSNSSNVTSTPSVSIYHTGVTLVDYNGNTSSTVYFISLTYTPSNSFEPYTVSVDSSENVTIFGSTFGPSGLIFKLSSSGSLVTGSSKFDQLSYSGNVGVQDSSGNYYFASTNNTYFCCCCSPYTYVEYFKYNSGFVYQNGFADNYGSGYAVVANSPPAIDSSGNIYFLVFDGTYSYSLAKVNFATNSVATYFYYSTNLTSANSISINSSNDLIYSGVYLVSPACVPVYYALIYSIPTSSLTGAKNWLLVEGSGTVGSFGPSTVDTSNNTYASLYYNSSPSNNRLVKINSSGAVQWQYTYSGVNYFQSLATDSSGNLYAVGTNLTSGITIVKVNSSGTPQFSGGGGRSLVISGGTISNPKLTVKGNVLYIAATFTPSVGNKQALMLKVPTDGTATKISTIESVYTFIYATASITQSAGTSVTFTSTLNVPLSLVTTVQNPSTITLNSVTINNAVTTL